MSRVIKVTNCRRCPLRETGHSNCTKKRVRHPNGYYVFKGIGYLPKGQKFPKWCPLGDYEVRNERA